MVKFYKGLVMNIRKATCKDIEMLSDLLFELFSQEVEFVPNRKKQKKGLKKIIEDKKIGYIFVAEKDDKIVGMINLLFSISTALGRKVGIIEDVIVFPSHRHKGVGTKLLSHVLDFAKKKKLKRLTLFTDVDNFRAHDFYESQGFCLSSMVQFKQTL
jgi:N-acetylglutamate synthase-like GNAT family acetyltransferase